VCIGALCPGVTLVIPPRSASVLVCSRGCLRGPSAAGKEASRAPGRRISTVQAYGRSAPPKPTWPGPQDPRARPSGGAVSEKRETATFPIRRGPALGGQDLRDPVDFSQTAVGPAWTPPTSDPSTRTSAVPTGALGRVERATSEHQKPWLHSARCVQLELLGRRTCRSFT
jgi:hypothetical protein